MQLAELRYDARRQSVIPEEAAIAAVLPPELMPLLWRLLELHASSPSAKKDLWGNCKDPTAATAFLRCALELSCCRFGRIFALLSVKARPLLYHYV
jgi:hypothetical protein